MSNKTIHIKIELPDRALQWLEFMAQEENLTLQDFLQEQIGEIIKTRIDYEVMNGKTALEVVTWAEEKVPDSKRLIEILTRDSAGAIWDAAQSEGDRIRKGYSFEHPEKLR
jgi:hypothetical protein